MRRIVGFCFFFLFLCSCAGKREPDWLMSNHAKQYPASAYLIAVGRGASEIEATENARGELAKIFSATIRAETVTSSVSVETYSDKGATGKTVLEVQENAKSSASKVLSGVEIAEIYEQAGSYAALAVLSKQRVSVALEERIASLEAEISKALANAGASTDALLRLRQEKRALRFAEERDALGADYRIVGSGNVPQTAPTTEAIAGMLAKSLENDVLVAVSLRGSAAEPIAQSLKEGLARQGLHFTTDPKIATVLIDGDVAYTPLAKGEGGFVYVRYHGGFSAKSAAGVELGGCTIDGKDGHLTPQEAQVRAQRNLAARTGEEGVKALSAAIFEGAR